MASTPHTTQTAEGNPCQPDAAPPAYVHRLDGLEPDNLLAVLALLGLLRALEAARAAWRPRAHWDMSAPWRPILTLAEPARQAEIAAAASEGVAGLAAHHAVTGSAADLKLTVADFAALREAADPAQTGVLDALSHPFVLTADGTLAQTPFAFMFGQGHQHFLQRFRDVPGGVPPKSLAESGQPDLRASDHVARALFRPWERRDPTQSFRWDPAEDRRYALRARDPSADAATTQHGANVLAAIALPLLPLFAVRRHGGARVLAPMTRHGPAREIEFTWPLWTRPARLAAIRALLAHPELAADLPDASALPQTAAVMRARRIQVGKYFNVAPARRIA